MWYSGLRGAMAYALALQAATKLETGPIILLDTLIYSVFTIIIQASFLNPILNKAGVVSKPGEKK
jgi:NhaP-type Na+/H+ or K+/H+ antiporter